MIIPDATEKDQGYSKGKGMADSEVIFTEHAADLSEGAPPPSYSPPTLAPGPGPLPTNHLLVQRREGSVRGRWTIDTSVQVPPSLLSTLPRGVTVRPNLKIETKDGAIDAEVFVQGDAERALIELITKDGPITCTPHQRLSIKGITKDGYIVVVLPRHFEGPLSYSTKDGRVVCSPAVQGRLTVFSELKREGKAFVGDHNLFSKENGPASWTGDEVAVRTKDGDIRFFFEGETIGPLVKKNCRS